MYAREIEGRTLTFGVSGKLIMNALVMYDRETDSLWSQFLGRSVRGAFADTQLEMLGSSLTTWSEWVGRHPDTLALDQGARPRSDPYRGYYTDGSAGVLGESIRDDRLDRKEFVVGVQWSDGARAYPFRELNETPVVNDTFEGRDLVVVFGLESGEASVWDRTIDGRELTFDPADPRSTSFPPTEGDAVPMRDRETGSLWLGRSGLAVEGPLAGAQLLRLPSLTVFWFAWSDFYPATGFFEG